MLSKGINLQFTKQPSCSSLGCFCHPSALVRGSIGSDLIFLISLKAGRQAGRRGGLQGMNDQTKDNEPFGQMRFASQL